jgi:hypothetical protein
VTETWKISTILHNFIEVLEQSLHKLSPENEQIIVRDFNIGIKNITSSFNTMYSNILNMMNLNHMRTDPTRITTSSSTFLDYIVCDTKEKISDTRRSFKGVGLGYGRQLYFQCLLKYMVVCALDNPPHFQASWQQRLFTLDMDSLTTNDLFSLLPFYRCIPCLFISYY